MRFVTMDDLGRKAAHLMRGLGDTGPLIVMDDGKPAALVVELSDDELEDYAVARNKELQRELDQAYAECLAGVGRPAAELLAELSARDE
jgi:PHD/YefM family antitoxin component YafN of YafNO toxin-antitoxin module